MADESATDLAAFGERIKKLTDEDSSAQWSANAVEVSERIRQQLDKLVTKPSSDNTPAK